MDLKRVDVVKTSSGEVAARNVLVAANNTVVTFIDYKEPCLANEIVEFFKSENEVDSKDMKHISSGYYLVMKDGTAERLASLRPRLLKKGNIVVSVLQGERCDFLHRIIAPTMPTSSSLVGLYLGTYRGVRDEFTFRARGEGIWDILITP